jgi:hypothetical protein
MTTPTEITSSYLMWVGSEHYSTIGDWSEEAITAGISKRLPGAAMASKLMEPGTVIFVAHDEGESEDCPKCTGVIECPDCRKREEECSRLRKECDGFMKRFEDRADFDANASGSQQRSVKLRESKIDQLENESTECELCDGLGSYKAGTGGHVETQDGEHVDYRTYNYWLHQPKKSGDFLDTITEKEMCGHCGGTGKLPCAKIFGMFVPEDVEYIVSGDETEEVLAKIKEFTKVSAKAVAAEPKRGCGKRKPGGTYVVTSPDRSATTASHAAVKDALAELVKQGIVDPEATDIKGSFVRFLEPIEVDVKRFRGIKSYSLDVDVEEAATDVMEAME